MTRKWLPSNEHALANSNIIHIWLNLYILVKRRLSLIAHSSKIASRLSRATLYNYHHLKQSIQSLIALYDDDSAFILTCSMQTMRACWLDWDKLCIFSMYIELLSLRTAITMTNWHNLRISSTSASLAIAVKLIDGIFSENSCCPSTSS